MAAGRSLSERTADELYRRIMVREEFAPGEKLPNETELSERLGVSRTTLREAIRYLVAKGILEVRRGLGTFIADDVEPHGDFGMHTLSAAIVRLSDMYEIRSMFEPQTAALACKRATDEEIEEICRLAELVESEAEAEGDWAGADRDFHEHIAIASHNEFIIQIFPIINAAVREMMLVSGNKALLKEIATGDNRMIVDFLRRRDEAGASSAMSIHILHLRHALNLVRE